MLIKDVKPGSRVFIRLTKSDYAIPMGSDIDCDVIAIMVENELDNTPPRTRIAFRKGERVTPLYVGLTFHYTELYPTYDRAEIIKPETKCEPAYNRRFLR
jgi:hypothetical protein